MGLTGMSLVGNFRVLGRCEELEIRSTVREERVVERIILFKSEVIIEDSLVFGGGVQLNSSSASTEGGMKSVLFIGGDKVLTFKASSRESCS